jgi:endonuclease/exonuclease/phosphatase family metal-dependent hydrolase
MLAIGAVLFWSRIPLGATVGAAVMAMGLVVAATLLPDTAARPAGSPALSALALSVGWVAFVALGFLYYAYYALPEAGWIATGVVALGLLASVSLRGRRFGRFGVLLVALLTVVVPAAAFVATPAGGQTAARPSFRLMTYNIHQGFDDGNVPSLDRIAQTIAAESPDVVVLQEVVRGWMIAEQHDALTVLAERLAMPYVFGPVIGDAYGNAVLSRVPIADVQYLRYERQPQLRHQPRGAIFFTVSGILVIATHLDHISDATEVRQGQVHAILAKWNAQRPAIVAGDLNALPGSAELRLLEDAGFRDLAKDDGADQPTSPATDPQHRVDYVWGIGVTGSQAHTVPSTASDHRPVVVNIARQ